MNDGRSVSNLAWIESHTVLLRHRKLIELSKDLRVKPVYAMGHLHALWHVALEQQEDGDLSSWSDELIADASSYLGDAGWYVSLLQQHKWLDGKLIHDWLDYAGKYLQSKYHNTNRRYLKEVWAKHGKHYGKSTSLRKRLGRSPPVRLGNVSSSLNSSPDSGWPSPEKLVELYNKLTPDDCAAVQTLSPARRAKAEEYLKIFPKQEFWEQVFDRVHHSRFLRGMQNKNGHGSFHFDFDWMLTKGKDGSENVVKVAEGRYADERK